MLHSNLVLLVTREFSIFCNLINQKNQVMYLSWVDNDINLNTKGVKFKFLKSSCMKK